MYGNRRKYVSRVQGRAENRARTAFGGAKPAQPYPSEISPTVAEFGKESYGAKPAAAPREPMPATEPQFPVGQQKMNRDPETHLNKNFTFDSFALMT